MLQPYIESATAHSDYNEEIKRIPGLFGGRGGAVN